MKNVVRLLLVWLMLLAIPFQGVASAAMLSCAHDAGRPAAHAQPAPAAAASGHCHEAQAAAQHHDQHQDRDQQHDHDSRCSACAACCMGAALGPAPAIASAPEPSQMRFAGAATGRLAAVDLALPERPPRFPLA